MLKQALEYLDMGLSVIPVARDKKPIVAWARWQKERPTHDMVATWWKRWPAANIGLVCGAVSGICVVDVDEPDKLESVNQHIPDFLEIPTAKTPGGGTHYYFGIENGDLGNATRFLPGVDFRANGGYIVAPPSVLASGFYQWVIPFHRQSLIKLPETLYNILNNNKYNNIYNSNNLKDLLITKRLTTKDSLIVTGKAVLGDQSDGESNKEITDKLTICLHDGRRNDSLNKILFHAYRGGMSFENGLYLARFIGESTFNKDGTEGLKMDPKEVEATNLSAWNGAHKKSMAQEVRDWVSLQNGYFNLTDFRGFMGNAYNLLTKEDRKNLYVIMNRLKDQDLIEKHPTKSGCYRKREHDLVKIDLEETKGEQWEFDFPLEFQKLVNVFEKQIILIYSGPDGGKSAYLFDFMSRNMDKYPKRINYFTSEMGSQELVSRLGMSNRTIKEWKEKVNFYEKKGNFSDGLKPNDINILDFISIHEEFSLIAKEIDAVWERIIKGIAIVILQSKYNSDLPRGAEFALEKPRLAFTLWKKASGNNFHHLCKITKAKNWKNHLYNPNYKVCKFLIKDGCKILTNGIWMNEDEYETMEKGRVGL